MTSTNYVPDTGGGTLEGSRSRLSFKGLGISVATGAANKASVGLVGVVAPADAAAFLACRVGGRLLAPSFARS